MIFDAVIAYKLVWVKVFLLVITPAIMLFDSYTETWSQTDWNNQTQFSMLRLYAKMFLASSAPFIAFIDQSMKRAEEEFIRRKDKRQRDETNTQMLKKGDIEL